MKRLDTKRFRKNITKLCNSSADYKPAWGQVENAAQFRSILRFLDMKASEIDFSSFTLEEAINLCLIYEGNDYEAIEAITEELKISSLIWEQISDILAEKAVSHDKLLFI